MNMNNTPVALAGIARAGVLVDLCIRTYSGRKQDKSTQEEVQHAKGATSAHAASVYKSLFADCPELHDIIKFQAKVRDTHYKLTMPWSDNGSRLLPILGLQNYKARMDAYQGEFDALVQRFLDRYDTLVAAAAFKLGALFNRNDYLLREQVQRKFSMAVTFSPLPTSGDFRIDAERDIQESLIRDYEERAASLVLQAQREAWTRLHETLTHLTERLTDKDGKRPRIYDSLVTNPLELCSLLTTFNVTNDPALERARVQLEQVMLGTSADDLRKFPDARADVKDKVQNILSQFDWGPIEGDE